MRSRTSPRRRPRTSGARAAGCRVASGHRPGRRGDGQGRGPAGDRDGEGVRRRIGGQRQGAPAAPRHQLRNHLRAAPWEGAARRQSVLVGRRRSATDPSPLSARGRHPVRVPIGLAPLGNAAWRWVATWRRLGGARSSRALADYGSLDARTSAARISGAAPRRCWLAIRAATMAPLAWASRAASSGMHRRSRRCRRGSRPRTRRSFHFFVGERDSAGEQIGEARRAVHRPRRSWQRRHTEVMRVWT